MAEDRLFRIELLALTRSEPEGDPWPPELADLARELVRWERISRDDHAELFRAPRFSPDPEGTMWAPMSDARASALGDAIASARFGFRFTSAVAHDDLTPLKLAMSLAASALASCDGVAAVDAGTGVGWSAEDYCERACVLNEEDEITLCDFVRVEHEPSGAGKITVRTRGMRAFGQRELVISDLDEKYGQFATWLVLQALGRYAALRRPLLPGQNFGYTRADPSSKLFFAEGGDLALVITDCHPEDKRAAAGHARLLVNLFPSFLVAHHEMTSPPAPGADQSDDDDDDDGDDDADTSKIASVEDYAQLTRALHGPDPEAAMASWGVTWRTLASVTYEWTAELADPKARETLEAIVFAP